MSVQTNGGNNDNDIFTNGHTENSSKITSANSIESLDNCSTVSSGDPSNQVIYLFIFPNLKNKNAKILIFVHTIFNPF